MKQFKYILSSLVLLAPIVAHAQRVDDPPIYEGYKIENGVATQKKVSDPTGDTYTLTLETFATGVTTVLDVTKPADIVLVLDVSGSMVLPMTYKKTTKTRLYYSDVGKVEYVSDMKYWYLSDDGNYYCIQGEEDRTYYYLVYYDSNEDRHILGQTTWWNNNAIITNTSRVYECDESRLDKLKKAVSAFIAEIKDNAINKKKADGTKEERTEHLDNRVSIVKFSGGYYNSESSIARGNHSYYTEVLVPFLNVETGDFSAVDNLVAAGVTYADYGMTKAYYLFKDLYNRFPKRDSNRTVVMFTDGSPTHTGDGSDFNSIADNTIGASNALKVDYDASVFTVGVFDSITDEITNYMERTSSLYKGATSRTSGERVDTDIKYYQDASDPDTDLTSIFEDIAKASGGSEESIPVETMLVDAVSNSFEVPSTFKASDVVVYTRSINKNGTAWEGSATTTALNKIILPENYDLTKLPPENIATQLADENTVGVYLKDGQLMIIGFNYSKPDSDGADGTYAHPYDGNWVGWRDNGETCAGKEVVIEFQVEAKDGVTGGDGTNTNKPSSGVRVPVYDKDGNFTGYKSINSYPYPQTDLPINLVIVKEGLRRGESATIQIYRAPQKAGEYDKNTGKPSPDLTNGWENFTKVILTNTTDEDFVNVTKTLLCLDPSYVYRLKEDDWGWGYELDKKDLNTSEQESNPFTFSNTLKSGVVKHAESVSINIFGEDHDQKTYKASKVESSSF